jgi:hypothetical protein
VHAGLPAFAWADRAEPLPLAIETTTWFRLWLPELGLVTW